MKTYIEAYGERLDRNEKALLELANKILEIHPEVEIYRHHDLQRKVSSLKFFKGELINSIGFHEVPYRWSGCGYGEHSNSHNGGENVCMPFDVEDVMTTFKPVTSIKFRQPNEYFKSKEQYLKWHSFLVPYKFN